MSRREEIWSFNSLDPLRSPLRWFEGISKVIRFTCNLTISELNDGYHIDWTPVIGDNSFSDPEISFSPNSQDFKSKFSGGNVPWVHICFAYQGFVRQTVEIQPQHHHDKTHGLSLNHEPMWLPSSDPRWQVFLGFSISSSISSWPRLLVFSSVWNSLRTAVEIGEGALDIAWLKT